MSQPDPSNLTKEGTIEYFEETDLLDWDGEDDLEKVEGVVDDGTDEIGFEGIEEVLAKSELEEEKKRKDDAQGRLIGGPAKSNIMDAFKKTSTNHEVDTSIAVKSEDPKTKIVDGVEVPKKHSSLNHALLGASLAKSGQEGVDQKAVAQKIYAATVGSTYFKNEERRDENLTRQIELLLQKKHELGEVGYKINLAKADAIIAEFEATRDVSQFIATVDCDAFYASVEELDHPEYKDIPFAVGGGVLTTANYVARKFGVRSGMAEHVAMKLCPQLLVLRPNFIKYIGKAKEIRAIMSEYDDQMEASSIDEAHLNLTDYCAVTGRDVEDVVNEMRARILEETKISVSAGIAPNDTIAKIASNTNKPNGQFRVGNSREACMAFMATLPCRKVTGIGRVFERQLDTLGVKVCGDIYKERAWLHALCTPKEFAFLIKKYLGLGRSHFEPATEHERKSVGTESSFRAIQGRAAYREKILWTARLLEKYMIDANAVGRTLQLSIKLSDFTLHQRQQPLHLTVYKADDIYKSAMNLLNRFISQWGANFKCRLIGLRLTNLTPLVKPHVTFKDLGKGPAIVKRGNIEHGQIPKISDEHFKGCPQQRRSLRPAAPPPKPQWECMMCEKCIDAEDNMAINEHLDFCLNKAAIMDSVRNALVPESKKEAPVVAKRETTATRKKEASPPVEIMKPGKRASPGNGKRTDLVVHQDKKMRTLKHFFPAIE